MGGAAWPLQLVSAVPGAHSHFSFGCHCFEFANFGRKPCPTIVITSACKQCKSLNLRIWPTIRITANFNQCQSLHCMCRLPDACQLRLRSYSLMLLLFCCCKHCHHQCCFHCISYHCYYYLFMRRVLEFRPDQGLQGLHYSLLLSPFPLLQPLSLLFSWSLTLSSCAGC